jgi:glutathione peroxidase
MKLSGRFKIVVGVVIMGLLSFLGLRSPSLPAPDSLYDLSLKTLDGETISFDRYRGKTLLIVNTASKCGNTPQYAELQSLHEKFGDRVTILGFPANNFLWQEPGTHEEIAAFCEKNYGVTFQMFEKISVRGRDQHPLYRWLTEHSGNKPSWNFCKYLVNESGEVVGFFGPKVSPLDEAILSHITG